MYLYEYCMLREGGLERGVGQFEKTCCLRYFIFYKDEHDQVSFFDGH